MHENNLVNTYMQTTTSLLHNLHII